ncbi:hypothetical protein F5883DRAFT_210811 [Diaporthe sp. PMI_573]|nr:hypothetical protein F5883DRAFT_210811 [Diaporthaceae sp. PMI_573]
MAEDVSIPLGRRAIEVSSVINTAILERRIKPSEGCYPLASDIVVRLCLINKYLGSLPPYCICSSTSVLAIHSYVLDKKYCTR